jgi:hypothetical protein
MCLSSPIERKLSGEVGSNGVEHEAIYSPEIHSHRMDWPHCSRIVYVTAGLGAVGRKFQKHTTGTGTNLNEHASN